MSAWSEERFRERGRHQGGEGTLLSYAIPSPITSPVPLARTERNSPTDLPAGLRAAVRTISTAMRSALPGKVIQAGGPVLLEIAVPGVKDTLAALPAASASSSVKGRWRRGKGLGTEGVRNSWRLAPCSLPGERTRQLARGSTEGQCRPLPDVHLPPAEHRRLAVRVVGQQVVLLLGEHLGRPPGTGPPCGRGSPRGQPRRLGVPPPPDARNPRGPRPRPRGPCPR
jgi:hypothetical protein